MGQSKRARLSFVRDDGGRVGWSSQDSAWFPAAAAPAKPRPPNETPNPRPRPPAPDNSAVRRDSSGQPPTGVDAVKLAFYRPYFYGAGDLTHETMRGPSDWSIGDRELMAAVVSGQ
ncbi:MAG: hypothetical protein ACXWD3_01395 [Mycobacterium sp.]